MRILLAIGFILLPWVVSGNQLEQIKPDYRGLRTGYDAKHTPKIEAPDRVKAGEWFQVKVSIGAGAEHPSMDVHHIEWIALYKDDVEISRIYLHPVYSKPEVTFTITLDGSATLRVLEQPNHTAPWEARKRIKVIAAEKKEGGESK